MNVGIVAQRENPRAAELAVSITERLRGEGVDVVVDETTAASDTVEGVGLSGVPVEAMGDTDLVVSIGGDGTFLYAARGAGTTPIVGVNLGEVGFLNAVSPVDAVESVSATVARFQEQGAVDTRRMSRLQATAESLDVPPAINEIAVLGGQRGHDNGLDLAVRVDGSLYTSGHADGVLVVTPTGSTAYNLSEGGPLVHPSVSGLVVTEMAGESAMPPLVVDMDSTVTVHVENAPEAVVVSDGRLADSVATPQEIELARADEPVHVAGPELDFFAGLGKLD